MHTHTHTHTHTPSSIVFGTAGSPRKPPAQEASSLFPAGADALQQAESTAGLLLPQLRALPSQSCVSRLLVVCAHCSGIDPT